ncbi:hypothetical protein [Tenacibaculum maritimum]|uniref:hypothetical protein n=1 Tax=Tenacibaculum maritimum TaxID=107401 RepID=UPI00387643D6
MMKLLKKNPLYVLLWILIIPILIYLLFKWFFLSSEESVFSELDSSGASISDVEAKSIAEGLYNSMSGFGTDEDTIFDLLSGISSANFSKVYNAFGERYYWHELGVWTDDSIFSNGHKIDLFGWLRSELSSSEFLKLSDLTNGIV